MLVRDAAPRQGDVRRAAGPAVRRAPTDGFPFRGYRYLHSTPGEILPPRSNGRSPRRLPACACIGQRRSRAAPAREATGGARPGYGQLQPQRQTMTCLGVGLQRRDSGTRGPDHRPRDGGACGPPVKPRLLRAFDQAALRGNVPAGTSRPAWTPGSRRSWRYWAPSRLRVSSSTSARLRAP